VRLFVTGGTGFIGRHFIHQAILAGHQVRALRRSSVRAADAFAPDIEWLEGTLEKIPPDSFDQVDALVHLACHSANAPYDSLSRCMYWNVAASIGLAELASEAGVRHFLVAGTCFEYGLSADLHAFLETDTPLQPVLSYPTSKAAASLGFSALCRARGLQLKILRIFQAFGEGEAESRFWPSLRRAALSGKDFPLSPGEQLRDFIAVEDIARQILGHLDFSHSQAGIPEIHHVASGQYRSLADFARAWWMHWNAPGQLLLGALPYRPGEQMRIIPAGSRPMR
jgi:nucleoside-diphosphate-sugar epimerase